MKFPRIASLIVTTLALVVVPPMVAQHQHGAHGGHGTASKQDRGAKGQLVKLTKSEQDSEWAKQARASYPLDVCVVSEEKLDSMGGPADYAYRVKGQPDRLVRFCCAGCDGDFADNPAEFLAKLDAAGKQKSQPAQAAK